jgi:hypothetical protein
MEEPMTTGPQDKLSRHLRDSIERLQRQVEKVDFWATVMTGFSEPVPDYEPESTKVSRYVKPEPRRKRKRRRAPAGKAGAAGDAYTRMGMST